ncbi:CII family transcriptional regulator [Pseudomonas sp. NPDC086251]
MAPGIESRLIHDCNVLFQRANSSSLGVARDKASRWKTTWVCFMARP